MKKIIMNSTVLLNGRSLPINAGVSQTLGCYVEILEAIDDQLTAMLNHHSKLLVILLGFHLHHYTETNKGMSQFMRKIKKRLKRKYKMLRIGHVWVRETHNATKPHYHLALMVNGNAVLHSCNVIQLCESLWQDMGNPKPHTPKNCYHTISRGDEIKYCKVFRRLSYFAKIRDKGRKPKATNDYSTSRISCTGSRSKNV